MVHDEQAWTATKDIQASRRSPTPRRAAAGLHDTQYIQADGRLIQDAFVNTHEPGSSTSATGGLGHRAFENALALLREGRPAGVDCGCTGLLALRREVATMNGAAAKWIAKPLLRAGVLLMLCLNVALASDCIPVPSSRVIQTGPDVPELRVCPGERPPATLESAARQFILAMPEEISAAVLTGPVASEEFSQRHPRMREVMEYLGKRWGLDSPASPLAQSLGEMGFHSVLWKMYAIAEAARQVARDEEIDVAWLGSFSALDVGDNMLPIDPVPTDCRRSPPTHFGGINVQLGARGEWYRLRSVVYVKCDNTSRSMAYFFELGWIDISKAVVESDDHIRFVRLRLDGGN